MLFQFASRTSSFLIKVHDNPLRRNRQIARHSYSVKHNKDVDMGKDGSKNEDKETQIDRRLRDFFSTTEQFTVVEKVMESFLGKNNEEEKNPDSIPENVLPILTRCNNDDDGFINGDDEDDWSKLFDPLFSTTHIINSSVDNLNSLVKHTDLKDKSNQKRRGQSFKITVAYKGSSYCGWQIQPSNEIPSVQQTLINILDPILGNNNDVEAKKKPIDIRVCGRTDAGVSAIAQVCRVRTLRSSNEITSIGIQNRINDDMLLTGIGNKNSLDGKNLFCTSVQKVGDKFHPTFGAQNRAYAYIIDSIELGELINSIPDASNNVSVEKVVFILNKMARRVEGLELDYKGLSFGKVKTSTTLCTILRARVSQISLNNHEDSLIQEAICFEFVGNRFLRRMIRIMVSTLLNLTMQCLVEENNEEEVFEDLFLTLIQECDRKMSSKPAASDGLIFVGATFDEDH